MAGRIRIPPPNRARRSHAERTAETRARVLAAVVESISEVGFQKTTAAEIARRAGVTWGAVQHHFGDKDGILTAVLEASFDRFAELLEESPVPDEEASVEERATLFVERSWAHFSSAHYRSTLEILLNLPEDLEMGWQTEMLDAFLRIWLLYFPEATSSRHRRPARAGLELMHYAISVLSGLAVTGLLEGRTAATAPRRRELGFLVDTLAREIG